MGKGNDHFYDDIDDGTIEELMKSYKIETDLSFFTCLKLDKHTDKMFGIMKDNFKGLEIKDMKSKDQLFEAVFQTIKESIERTCSPSFISA